MHEAVDTKGLWYPNCNTFHEAKTDFKIKIYLICSVLRKILTDTCTKKRTDAAWQSRLTMNQCILWMRFLSPIGERKSVGSRRYEEDTDQREGFTSTPFITDICKRISWIESDIFTLAMGQCHRKICKLRSCHRLCQIDHWPGHWQ